MKTNLMIRKNAMLKGRLAKKAGAVMMEYVLVAVLIAAAAVVAMVKLGRGVTDTAGAATLAVVGNSTGAQEQIEIARESAETGVQEAVDANEAYNR